MAEYRYRDIETKWQQIWRDKALYKTPAQANDKPKYYVLDMFPYPSGAGLHVGHPLGYIASDIYARYKRITGYNVLHPMGYDAFGLPAEQYAIQTGQHPAITTKQNIERYREQLDKLGLSFDWDREVQTSDPDYYKWTQWIFLKLFNSWYNRKNDKAEPIESLTAIFETQGFRGQDDTVLTGDIEHNIPAFTADEWKQFPEKEKQDILLNFRLAYLSEAYVNWCPAMGTVLANEEVKDGVSERGGFPVERKLMKQWSLRITAYADRLLQDLDTIDWSESIKESQRNWIGKSEGCSLRFSLTPSPSPKERGAKPHWQTADKKKWEVLKEFRRKNRKEPTKAESLLWEAVRDSQLDHKIRRQHAIGPFIVDFASIAQRLVIEIDGGIHDTTEQKEYDTEREYLLKAFGYQTVRFSNDEVINDIASVLKKIKETLSKGEGLGEANEAGRGVEVFTTRPDTIFGVSFITLAPEHELVEELTTDDQRAAVEEYISYAKNRSERDRMADVKKVTGQFTGSYAIHPFSGEPIPVWIGDYVLAGYGTGAVMGVPAHDSRDHAFATHFGLPLKQVIEAPAGHNIQEASYDEKAGRVINSDFLDGLEVKAAIKRAIEEAEAREIGKGKTNYRLRDAVFGRQRYWGEPIPIYYKDGIAYPFKEEHLPLRLPEIDKFLPTEDGEPPLARAKDWHYDPSRENDDPFGGITPASAGSYPIETTTMPGWAGSSWYFLRYMDPHNDKAFASKEAIQYWKNVDLYIGGAEHATGHLLYVRFWTKFLFDLGLIPEKEPAKKLINQGMIQGISCFFHVIPTHSGRVKHPFILVSKDAMLKHLSGTDNDFLLKKFRDIVAAYNKGISIEELASFYPHFNNDKTEFVAHRADVQFVSGADYRLDIEKFTPWVKQIYSYKEVEFITEPEGHFICSTEVEKMSKSKYNVVSPDEICDNYGADTLRLYEMFLGPLEMSKPWNTNGIEGVFRFLNKLWRLVHDENNNFSISDEKPTVEELKILHKAIKKVKEDIEGFSFNTAVSAFMIAVNELSSLKCRKKAIIEPFLVTLSPFAPHITEELWQLCGNSESILLQPYPAHDENLLVESAFSYPISINGKVRTNIEFSLDAEPRQMEDSVLQNETVQRWLEGKPAKKVIIVKGRIVNVVV